MFDNLSNLIFILIGVAVVIGRTIMQARKKPAPPPRRVVPPVHFEENPPAALSRKSSENIRRANAAARAQSKDRQRTATGLVFKEELSVPAPRTPVRNIGLTPEGYSFPLNLSHLSPLKQAVIMAEILGPPKGMSDW